MKIFKGFFIVVLATMVLTGCSRSLESAVEQMNDELPQNIGNGQTLTKVSIEGEYLVFYGKYDESEHRFDDYQVRKEWKKIEKDNGFRKEMMNSLLGEDNEFIELIKKEKKGVKMVLYGEISGETISFTIVNPGEF